MSRFRCPVAVIAAVAAISMGVAGAFAAAVVSIGNGPSAPDGSYRNAEEIANTMAFTNANISATTSIGVVDNIDLSYSPTFGPTFFNISLGAPTVNINNNMNMGSGNVNFSGTTVNLTGKITQGATLLGPTRFGTNVTQVNVLAGTASIQQAISLSSPSAPVTVQVSTGQYNENVSIGKSLTLTNSAPAGQTNHGVLKILTSGLTATVTGASFTNATDGTMTGVGTFNVAGLTGAGFVNHGTVAPGLSPGILSFTGDYNQASDGDFEIEIGGTAVGTQYDRLTISGDASLDGLLHASLINGFTPGPSDTFTILSASGRSGVFSNAASSIVVGAHMFDVTYTPTSVVLGNYQPVPEPTGLMLVSLASAALLPRSRRKRGECKP